MAKPQRLTYSELLDLKTAIWDIESGGLDANFDPILCASIKRFGHKKVKTFRIDKFTINPWDDKELCNEIAWELETYDVICHHYGDRFDLPFLNTRLLYWGTILVDTSAMRTVDTWWTLRYRYKLNSNRLATASEFLGCKNKKTPLSGDIWMKAKCGVKGALDYVVKHNVADVLVLEEVVKTLAKAAPLRFRYWR